MRSKMGQLGGRGGGGGGFLSLALFARFAALSVFCLVPGRSRKLNGISGDDVAVVA